MIRKKIGKRIKELRINTGLSQEVFALKAGLDRSYFASVEAGKRNICILNLEKIWVALDVTPEVFFSSVIFNDTSQDI